MKKLESIIDMITEVKLQLMSLGDMHPGSVTQQYNVCGVKNCKCKDKENPQKHGPYYQLSFTNKGKSSSRFIKKENLEECQKQIENYQKFKELTTEWKSLSVDYAKQKAELEKLVK